MAVVPKNIQLGLVSIAHEFLMRGHLGTKIESGSSFISLAFGLILWG